MNSLRDQAARWSEGFALRRQIAVLRSREKSTLDAVIELLDRIRGFVVPADEINSAEFVEQIEALRSRLLQQQQQSRRKVANRDLSFIGDYAARQLEYLKSTEHELRGIIEVLSEGLKAVGTCNAEFHLTISTHLERLAGIRQLDDLRELRSRLDAEISSVSSSLSDVQEHQAEQMQRLSGQVHVLREKLEQAEMEASHDGLTGILNRRAADRWLESSLAEFHARGSKFSVVLMDLDDFKEINDEFGHDVGDRALLAVVEVCRATIRQEDLFARYGGDEFLLVFPRASVQQAARIAEKLRDSIVRTRFQMKPDSASESDTESIRYLSLAATFGATSCKKGDTSTSILRRADEALYKAKKAGKQAVETA